MRHHCYCSGEVSYQGHSQPHCPQWARVPLSLFFHHLFLFSLKLSSFLSSFWPSRWVTRPPGKALAMPLSLTSTIVPLVMTPNDVYMGELGFFFTPMIGRQNVAFSSGCVTCAFLKRSACRIKITDN